METLHSGSLLGLEVNATVPLHVAKVSVCTKSFVTISFCISIAPLYFVETSVSEVIFSIVDPLPVTAFHP